MKDCDLTIFVLQFQCSRRTSEWANPDSEWEDYPDDDWSECGESFGIDPHNNKGNDLKWLHVKAHEDLSTVKQLTGHHGWENIKYAIRGMKLARMKDAAGKNDYIDPGCGSKLMRRVRHKFRIAKIVVSHETTVVDLETVVDAMPV